MFDIYWVGDSLITGLTCPAEVKTQQMSESGFLVLLGAEGPAFLSDTGRLLAGWAGNLSERSGRVQSDCGDGTAG